MKQTGSNQQLKHQMDQEPNWLVKYKALVQVRFWRLWSTRPHLLGESRWAQTVGLLHQILLNPVCLCVSAGLCPSAVPGSESPSHPPFNWSLLVYLCCWAPVAGALLCSVNSSCWNVDTFSLWAQLDSLCVNKPLPLFLLSNKHELVPNLLSLCPVLQGAVKEPVDLLIFFPPALTALHLLLLFSVSSVEQLLFNICNWCVWRCY